MSQPSNPAPAHQPAAVADPEKAVLDAAAGLPKLVEVNNVSFGYGSGLLQRNRNSVLDQVSFDLFPGETLAVLGRNGAGKSTLLRLLAGIYEPDEGTIWRADVEMSLLSLQVGFLGYLTGRQNCVVSSMLLGKTRQWVTDNIDEIMEFAELQGSMDQPIKTYSAGMRARLGFAISYLANPEVILIDEVLGVGDIDFREKSTAAMKERLRSNKTVVLVTHHLSTVQELADRVVWIEGGKLQDIGTPEEILPRYMAFGKKTA